MKGMLILLLGALLPVFAQAFPATGDESVLAGTVTIQGQTHPLVVKQNLGAFNNTNGTYVLDRKVFLGGQLFDSETVEAPVDDLFSQTIADLILNNCSGDIGQPEVINVPAGQGLATCKMPVADTFGLLSDVGATQKGFVWVGRVPFGAVKTQTTEENGGNTIKTSLELQSYQAGQN